MEFGGRSIMRVVPNSNNMKRDTYSLTLTWWYPLWNKRDVSRKFLRKGPSKKFPHCLPIIISYNDPGRSCLSPIKNERKKTVCGSVLISPPQKTTVIRNQLGRTARRIVLRSDLQYGRFWQHPRVAENISSLRDFLQLFISLNVNPRDAILKTFSSRSFLKWSNLSSDKIGIKWILSAIQNRKA